MDTPDYYALLEVDPGSGRAEIRQAFRRLSLTCHPDVHPGDQAVLPRFQLIVQAHAVLTDPDRRAAYDARRAGKAINHEEPVGRPSFDEWVTRYHAAL